MKRELWVPLLLVLAVGAAWQAWLGYGRHTVGQRLAASAAPGDIQMLSSTTCGICTQARVWFQQHEVPFDECFIERNAACAARFQRLMAPGTPVIMVKGQMQLGFEPQRILAQLQSPALKPSSAASPRP